MAKFCTNCGNELVAEAVICPKCGVSASPVQEVQNKPSNGMAIAGFITSFFISILGLIFSIIGLNKSKQTGTGKGLSIAGIIISSITTIITIIVILSFITVMTSYNKTKEKLNTQYQDYNYNYNYYD